MVVGLELAHRCTCPDKSTPLIFQIGICNSCLVDCVMRQFREVKHARMVALAKDMTAAANAIREARTKANLNATIAISSAKSPT